MVTETRVDLKLQVTKNELFVSDIPIFDDSQAVPFQEKSALSRRKHLLSVEWTVGGATP